MKLLCCLALGWAFAQTFACVPMASAQPAMTSAAEDFAAASIATSPLHPDTPALIEKDEEPDYISEWVTVQWRSDDPIYLYVVRPTKVQKPPVVMYLYDYPSETDVFRDDDWCRRTTAGGYAAVGFVPALSGHRYHSRPLKEWFVSELQEALAKSSHDVEMVLDYLARRGDVDVNHVGMFGVGAGATIAVMAASVDARIQALDLVDPWGDWPVWLAKSPVVPEEERTLYLKPEFLKRVAMFDPVALLPKLSTPRVRLDQVSAGSSVPGDAQQHIASALPAAAERHQFANSTQLDPMATSNGKMFDWLKLQLKARESTEAVSQRGAAASVVPKEESQAK